MNTEHDSQISKFLNDPEFIYWAKTGSDANDRWDNWLIDHPEDRDALEQAKWIAKGIELKKVDVAPSLIDAKFNEVMERVEKRERQSKMKLRLKLWWSVAAAISLFALTYVGLQQMASPSSSVVISAGAGQVLHHELADGSRVIINANSKIKYVKGNPREIWLDGEAYFDVAKKPEGGDRFLVHTDDLIVEVLGTMFNVDTRYQATKVFLEEGEVKLEFRSDDKGPLMMAPGEVVTYSKDLGEEPKKITSTGKSETSWKDGVLIFEDATILDVLKEINSIYRRSIVVEDPNLASQPFQIPVPIRDEEIALEVLQKVSGLRLIRSSDPWKLVKVERKKPD